MERRNTAAAWFEHGANFRNDIRVKALRSEFGPTGYATICMILEVLSDSDGFRTDIGLPLLAIDFGLDNGSLTDIVSRATEYGILSLSEDGEMSSPLLDRYMQGLMDKRERNRAYYEERRKNRDKADPDVSGKSQQDSECFSKIQHDSEKFRKIQHDSEKFSTIQKNSADTVQYSNSTVTVQIQDSKKRINEKKRSETEITEADIVSDDKPTRFDRALAEKARTEFERFRVAYKGSKRGFGTEFDNFVRKNPRDWPDIAVRLHGIYMAQEAEKDKARLRGCFVPVEKHLQTYINQRCWEYEMTFENNNISNNHGQRTIDESGLGRAARAASLAESVWQGGLSEPSSGKDADCRGDRECGGAIVPGVP